MQAQADAGVSSGPTTALLDEIKVLKRNVRDLEETNEPQSRSIFLREGTRVNADRK
jgi:hypothetical protein